MRSRVIDFMRAMVSPSFCTSFGREVLEDGRGLFLAERHQQDRGVLDALVVVLFDAGMGRVVSGRCAAVRRRLRR